MYQLGVIQLVQVLDAEGFLRLGYAGIRQLNRLTFDVDLIVFVRLQHLTKRSACRYRLAVCFWPPEMINGVRDSSTRIESTSSTSAKFSGRRTRSSRG